MGEWEPHINGCYLMGSHAMDKAAIASQEGSLLGTSAGNFNIRPEEVVALVKACQGDQSCLASGLYLEGIKYLAINQMDNQVNLKAAQLVNNAKPSASAIITHRLLVVGIDSDGASKGALAKNIYNCGNYLRDSQC